MISNVLPNDIVVDKVRRYYCLTGWLIARLNAHCAAECSRSSL